MNGIIYKVTNNINGKIYIGKTTRSLEKRKKVHYYDCKKKTYFHLALLKYPKESFLWETIFECYNEKELSEMEKFFIANYKITDILYNLTDGGEGTSGFKFSESSKEKLKIIQKKRREDPEYSKKHSIAMKLKWKEPGYKDKISLANKNKKRSDESRKNMSESKKGPKNYNFGKHLSKETRKKLSIAHIGKNTWMTGKPAWNKGKIGIYTDEVRKSVSDKIKKLWEDPEYRKHMSLAHKKKNVEK